MASAFDQLSIAANRHLFRVHGDIVEIDNLPGTAIVVPDSDLALGGGVQLYNGAHLTFIAAEFPNVVVNSEVQYDNTYYVIVELDDVDSSGVRKARMAKK